MDVQERAHWNKYQDAYESMIKHTATTIAPWYIIPADNQWVSRALVGNLLAETLESLHLNYPILNDTELNELEASKQKLLNE